MKITISKSKNSTIYYLSKSVRINGKSTTKTIEKLGTHEELQARAGDMDPLEWAKQYAAQRTLEDKKGKTDVIIKYSSSKLIDKDVNRSVNAGYLFLQDIYYSLGLDKICAEISDKTKATYDLNSILAHLCYTRILSPSSKRASLEFSKQFIELPTYELQHVYRGLEDLANENDLFQAKLFQNSKHAIERNTGILYYDCTNYYFEIEEEDDFRKYGLSKEHRPNPIVQMGLLMDADGMPLSFCLFNGNENEQPSLTPLEQKVIDEYGLKKFVVCTDAGLSSTANRKFNNVANRKFVTTQSIKKLKGFLQDFCLDPEGWHLPNSTKAYNINELNEELDTNKTFYKSRWINENGLEQQLVVTFSLKHKNYQRLIRDKQIERAKKIVDNPTKANKVHTNDYKRLIENEHCTKDGEIASKQVVSLDQAKIDNEERYDGFYAVCTNLEDDAIDIVTVNQRRWEIEECFRIMKSEFKARPVYLSRQDRITAHFMTCFTALLMYRILEKKLDNKYTCEEIISTLKGMNMFVAPGEGYVPTYTRTDITDALHKAFNFRTDYQITSQRNMKKIITSTKK
ncbi:MAG: IS1634 family transposase [Eubacteriales bacterium]